MRTTKIYDKNDNLINSANSLCYIKIKENLSIGDKVYKTKDIQFYTELDKTYPKEFRRFPIDMNVIAYPNQPLIIYASCDNYDVTYNSNTLLDVAIKEPTSSEQIIKQLNRLNDTVYKLGNIETSLGNCFIPATKLNEARRYITDKLNEIRV